MLFTNLHTGHSHSFGGTYLELRPGERLRNTDRFDDPSVPGEMTVTVTFRPVSVGTELTIVHQNIPAAIPPEASYLGWQECSRSSRAWSRPRSRRPRTGRCAA